MVYYTLADKNKKLLVFVSYLLTIITSGIGFIIWLYLRETFMLFVMASSVSRWSLSAIDNFSFLLFGIIWLILVYFSQSFYSKGIENKKLTSRFLLITNIELLFLLICQLSPYVAGLVTFDSINLFWVVIEFLTVIILTLFLVKRKLETKFTRKERVL